MSDHDISLDEKRVYSAESGVETVFVAAEMGVASVSVSGSQIGRFGLDHQCEASDIAAGDGLVAVAAAEGVFVDTGGDAGFQDTGFGPATAVAVVDGTLLAAAENGIVARFDGAWTDLGRLDATVHAMDGDLLATDDGVVRVVDDALEPAGLRDVADVSATGVPHAAAADALYRLGNGWLDVQPGDFRVVAADPADAEPGAVGRAHAATPDDLYAHADGDWTPVDLPVDDPVVAVAYGDSTYVATDDGTLLLADDGDWRHRSLGLRGVTGIAVP